MDNRLCGFDFCSSTVFVPNPKVYKEISEKIRKLEWDMA